MTDYFYSIDTALFYFCNRTLANPVFDAVMPPLTNWNQSWIGLTGVALLLLYLFFVEGKRGKILALLLIPLIVMSDQMSSTLIKGLVMRPRPCHLMNGLPVLENIRLLVSCGSGYSFPSSHAVNNFAFATLVSFFYRKWRWALFGYAAIMGFSRVSVGVHYPSDVVGGAIIGIACAWIVIRVWKLFEQHYPFLLSEHR